jgi:hypothetical protein
VVEYVEDPDKLLELEVDGTPDDVENVGLDLDDEVVEEDELVPDDELDEPVQLALPSVNEGPGVPVGTPVG